MGLLNPHLDDAAFAEVWSERLVQGTSESTCPAEAHLRLCGDCRARYDAFGAWLENVRTEARSEAEEALTSDRLAVQQAQIARRLEALEQPARVIAFPRFARPISSQPNHRSRWIAGAAAAGLFVGLGLGQLMPLPGGAPGGLPSVTRESQQIARGSLAAGDSRIGAPPASLVSDEVFLDDQELTPSQARVPESLQYLNLITPSARDSDPR